MIMAVLVLIAWSSVQVSHTPSHTAAFETWGAKVWGGVGAEAGALTRGADTIAHDRVK